MAPSSNSPQLSSDLYIPKYYVLVAILLFGIFIVKPFVQSLLSPLRKVPGPFLARFTRLWELNALNKTDYAQYSIELHENYGPIVRLAPNRYSINDAEAVKTVLGHKDSLNKSDFYNSFNQPGNYNSFNAVTKDHHARIRRPIAQLYSQTSLLGYEPAVDACNSILLKRLQEYASEKKELNVRDLMQYYAFDVIGEITVGARFGIMENNGDKDGIIDTIWTALHYSANIGLVPGLHPWIVGLGSLFGIDSGFEKVTKFIRHHLEDRVSGNTKPPENRSDFLDKMLPLEQEGKVTRQDTRTACEQNVGAGSDTTAISLTSVISHLAMNPSALASLRKELDEATKNGSISDPVTFKEAQPLPYLQAVINEALRVHPAVGFPLVRVVGRNGAHLAGQYFPPGTEVGINPWVIHNNKSIFGPDASSFRPERWLTEQLGERGALERNMLAFGAGPRTCIGKNISLLEMYKVIPQIVRRFDFEIIPDEKTGKPYTNDTAWFVWQDVKCLVRNRAT